MFIMSACAEANARTTRNANVVASASAVLVADARAARTMALAVSAGTEVNARTIGDANIESSTGIIFVVASGWSSIILVFATKKGDTVL